MHNRLAVVAVLAGMVLLPSVSLAFSNLGFGSISGVVGGLRYFADDDSRDGVKPRLTFGGTAEYSPSARTAIRLDVSFGWNAYPADAEAERRFDDPKPVKIVSPTVLSYIRRINPGSDRFFYAGGGFGLYYWRYKISGEVQREPVNSSVIGSGKLWAFDTGVHALVGYEFPLTDTVALQGEFLGHYVFSGNEDERPTGWNGNDAFLTFRIGAKLYFDLSRLLPPEEEF